MRDLRNLSNDDDERDAEYDESQASRNARVRVPHIQRRHACAYHDNQRQYPRNPTYRMGEDAKAC